MTQLKTRTHNLHRTRSSATAGGTPLELMMQNASLSSSQAPTPHFVRRSPSLLTTIRTLPPQGLLVLFTPLVPSTSSYTPTSSGDEAEAEDSDAATAAPMDPFEPLGLALSQHHSRVRHVPYVPRVGITKTHLAFLHHASAIVVVTASAGPHDPRKEAGTAAGFARAVLAAVTKPDRETPTVLVRVGAAGAADAGGSDEDRDDAARLAGTVIQTPTYRAAHLRRVAALVFEG